MRRPSRSLLLCLLTCGTFMTAAMWQARGPDARTADELLPAVRAPRYWKGNLHTHSLWSDGDDFPEMIADWYKRNGYQFLALTDHNVLADGDRWVDAAPDGPRGTALRKYLARFGEHWVERRERDGKAQTRLKPLAEYRSLLEEPGRFLLVAGEEVSHQYAKLPIHINAINLRDVVRPVDGNSVPETIRVNHRLVADQAKRAGWRTLASLNHPNFGWAVRAEDLAGVDEVRFMEVFNGHPGVRNYGDAVHADVERMWDIVLALRLGKYRLPLVYGLATDDAHGYHAFGVGKVNPGRGWIMVRAPHLTAEALVRAAEAGDYYASTGVTLQDVRRDKEQLTVVIAPEQGVTYKTQFIATLMTAPLTSEPVRDADQKQLEVTRLYSKEIGKVVAEVEGVQATYRFTGQELYVRAKVMSNKPHPNPYQKGDLEVAWVQPVVP
jgi:hypothetical protein